MDKKAENMSKCAARNEYCKKRFQGAKNIEVAFGNKQCCYLGM